MRALNDWERSKLYRSMHLLLIARDGLASVERVPCGLSAGVIILDNARTEIVKVIERDRWENRQAMQGQLGRGQGYLDFAPVVSAMMEQGDL